MKKHTGLTAVEQALVLSRSERASVAQYMSKKQALVDTALEEILPLPSHCPTPIVEAMRYTLFSGGKRLRPIITLASAEAVGGEDEHALLVACAVELIHTYSLIHDDLPPVDNDDFRRGKPSNHKVFGEAMAIFAGDALLTHAFFIMTDTQRMKHVDPIKALKIAREVAHAIGIDGMIGGQTLDILYQGKDIEPHILDYIHYNKTATLIRVSARAGAIIGGGSDGQIQAISNYGSKVGLAFQIVDDLLDASQAEECSGSDQRLGKATYPALHGMEKSRQKATGLIQEALNEIAAFGPEADPLRQVARFIPMRDR